jgi:hypothetical protein
MGEVLPFRAPVRVAEELSAGEIDLLSAVDFALRDIADFARHLTGTDAREQAEACRQMLQDAFNAALRNAS